MPEPCFKPIEPGAHAQALALWHTVFGAAPGYFERYFAVDPWYQTGDCLGAWVGDTLASAVHVCRRPLDWKGRALWCGAIANVATLPDYRNRGLSRELLRLAIQRMEEQRLDFSMLFTGVVHHYAPLGWEPVRTPQAVLALRAPQTSTGSDRSDRTDPSDMSDISDLPGWAGTPAEALSQCLALYEQCPRRPLTLQRPEPYFRGWTGWEWAQGKTEGIVRDDGYAVLRTPEKPDRPVRLIELRSANAAAERRLIREAADRVRGRGIFRLTLEWLPSPEVLSGSESLGDVEITSDDGMMLRKVCQGEEDFREVVDLYRTGEAVWWPADGF